MTGPAEGAIVRRYAMGCGAVTDGVIASEHRESGNLVLIAEDGQIASSVLWAFSQ